MYTSSPYLFLPLMGSWLHVFPSSFLIKKGQSPMLSVCLSINTNSHFLLNTQCRLQIICFCASIISMSSSACVCVYIVGMAFNLLLVFSKYCEDVSTQIGAVERSFFEVGHSCHGPFRCVHSTLAFLSILRRAGLYGFNRRYTKGLVN